ncbi:unnamed protein product [Allacma fusca]|uniref:Fibronectin type-III domain-containing protein n=1 Tax=Allacma fusca TaxID=39272 RepID=A0A8J2KH42_9HEXA|nr:unnamed protein product [Allacma fusca]
MGKSSNVKNEPSALWLYARNCKAVLIIPLLLCTWNAGGEPSKGNRANLHDMVFRNSGLNSLLELKNEFGSSPSKIIPNHHYVSSFLNLGFTKRFLYINENGGNVLSIVVTPCTSPLLWSVRYWPVSNSSNHHFLEPQLLKSFRTDRSATFYDLKSRQGVYSVEIKPLYSDSYVHLYAFNGPEPIRIPSNFIEISDINPGVPKPRISVRRLRGNRLHVKWEPSAWNPHLMKPPRYNYFNSYGHNEKDRMDVMMDYPPQDPRNNRIDDQKRHYPTSFEQRERAKDIIIGCVNKKTNYILHSLQEGKLYYFNVFIKDSSTNLTYPYVRTTLKYRTPKHLPNGISDSKAKKVTIAPGNPTLLKFNLKKPCTEMSMYVMPCGGGAIRYQLIHAYKSIIESDIVDSLDILKIAMPEKGRYYIRLRQSPTLNSTFALMVEIYVSKKNKRFPLPKLPYNTQITEDRQERSCDSVKIQWQPSPEPKDNEYCIFLKEETRKRIFKFKKPNQCDVERSLNSDPYVTHSMCIQRSPPLAGGYLSQTVESLQPDTNYIVQVIVRRLKGKSLSYDLLQVSTLSECVDSTDQV